MALLSSISILCFQNFTFMLKTLNNHILTIQLGFIISFQKRNALIECFFSSLKVFNLSSDSGEVSIVEFLRFNFSSICSNYSLSDSLANLSHFKLFLMLILNFNIFLMLSLLTLLSMLLVMTECRSILDNLLDWTIQDSLFKNRRRNHNSLRGTWSHWSRNISAPIVNRLVFNFLSYEMSINIIRDISHILPPVLSHIVGDISWSGLSVLRLVNITLKAFALVGSWPCWEVVRTLISWSLLIILVWSYIVRSWLVLLQVLLGSNLDVSSFHRWLEHWLSWWRFLFFLHILSIVLFFILNVHFLCSFLMHEI